LPQNPNADKRQQIYLKAMEAFIPGLEIIYGHFTVHVQKAPLASNNQQWVEILKVEEKGSDVNLAATLVNDSWKNLFDCAVIISNDGDLAEALRIVSQEQHKQITLLTPPRFKKRRSKALKKYASVSLTIKNTHLAESQLPDPIPGTNIHKPASWKST
jgi:hypothetical protein